MHSSKNAIPLGQFVTDVSLEKNHDLIQQILDQSDEVIWDFQKASWIDLTALFRVLALVWSENNVSKHVIRFPRPKTDSDTSLCFMIRSGFFDAFVLIAYAKGATAEVQLPRMPKEDVKIDSLNSSFVRNYSGDEPVSNLPSFVKSKDSRFWQIGIPENYSDYFKRELLFRPFGYVPNAIKDIFPVPIHLYCNT